MVSWLYFEGSQMSLLPAPCITIIVSPEQNDPLQRLSIRSCMRITHHLYVCMYGRVYVFIQVPFRFHIVAQLQGLVAMTDDKT